MIRSFAVNVLPKAVQIEDILNKKKDAVLQNMQQCRLVQLLTVWLE